MAKKRTTQNSNFSGSAPVRGGSQSESGGARGAKETPSEGIHASGATYEETAERIGKSFTEGTKEGTSGLALLGRGVGGDED